MSNVGMRIIKNIKRPPQELVESFAGVPVANIADAMNRMFCIDARIRPMNSALLLGTAFTVRTRPSDNLILHKAIDMAGLGDIIVVDAQGGIENSLIGEIMITWAQQRGIAGFIIDGAIRDSAIIRKLDFPVYAAGITPKGPYKDGPGEINVVVTCGGIAVKPGDILVGDEDGVVVIDPLDAPTVLEKVRDVMAKETAMMAAVKNGTWDRAWVDKILAEKKCEYID